MDAATRSISEVSADETTIEVLIVGAFLSSGIAVLLPIRLVPGCLVEPVRWGREVTWANNDRAQPFWGF